VIVIVDNYDMISIALSKELASLLGFANANLYHDTRTPSIKRTETRGTTALIS